MSYFYVLSCSECEVFRIPILLLSCCLLHIFLSGPCIFWFWLWGYIFQNFIHVNDWCVPLKVWTFFCQVFGGISNPGQFYSKFTDLVFFFFDSLIEWFSLQTHIKSAWILWILQGVFFFLHLVPSFDMCTLFSFPLTEVMLFLSSV